MSENSVTARLLESPKEPDKYRSVKNAQQIEKEKFVLVILTDETSQKVSEKIKSDFMSNVTHELKPPLTAIMGFIETIDGPAKNDEKQKSKFLSIIKTEAERMQRLVNDTLALIRVEETEYQIPNEKVDIYRCASSAIDAAKQTADKKNIQMETLKSKEFLILVKNRIDKTSGILKLSH